MKRGVLLAAVKAAQAALAWCSAANAQERVELRVENCTVASPGLLDTLPAQWQRVRQFTRICPIPPRAVNPALRVLAIRLDQVLDAGILDWEYKEPPMPKPVILDKQNHPIGELPEGLPISPPSQLKVTFADWRGGWPHRITLFEAGESALPPHPLPSLIWNSTQRRYVERPSQGRR